MTAIPRVTALSVAAVLAAFGGPDARADERGLASVARATPVNVHAGTVVWSDHRPGEGYRLMAWSGGRARTLRVAPRRAPFDADLGPDRRGRPVVVYSRCRRERPRSVAAPLGCRLYRYDLRTDREERLEGIGRRGHSDLSPSIWRGRVAFARYEDPAREEYAVLHRILVHGPGDRLRRVRAGTPAGAGVADPDGNVTAIDLRGRRLAFGWVFTAGGCESLGDDSKGFSPTGTEVWALVVGGARRRVGEGCSDDGTAVHAPSLTPAGLELTSFAPAANERVALDRAGAERSRRPLGPAIAINSDGESVATVEPAGRRYRIVLADAAETASGSSALGTRARSGGRRGCVPDGARTVRRAGRARVYVRRDAAFACRPGVRVLLGELAGADTDGPCSLVVSRFTLRPRYAAWHTFSDCEDQQGWVVSVRRLARRAKARDLNTGRNACGSECPDYGIGPVSRIALTADGAVAWIAADASTADPTTYEVWKAARGSAARRLARGAGIDRTTLSWRGRAVLWREDGRRRRG